MSTTVEIISLLREIERRKREIRLINVYKGFPIAYPGSVLKIEGEAVKVKTEEFQLVCLYLDRYTYIQSDLLAGIIKAQVAKIEFSESIAYLTDFESVKGTIGKRTQVRVVPEEPIESVLNQSEKGFTLHGELADISLDGLGIYVAEKDFSPEMIEKGNRVAIFLRLPVEADIPSQSTQNIPPAKPLQYRYDDVRSGYKPKQYEHSPSIWGEPSRRRKKMTPEFKLEGYVVNMLHEHKHNRYRLGIHLLPSGYHERYGLDIHLLPRGYSREVISKFIVQRQTEIIREVRYLYDMLSKTDQQEKKGEGSQ